MKNKLYTLYEDQEKVFDIGRMQYCSIHSYVRPLADMRTEIVAIVKVMKKSKRKFNRLLFWNKSNSTESDN